MDNSTVKNETTANTELAQEVKTVTPEKAEITKTETTQETAATDTNKYKLKRLDENFIYELMQVPTASHHEYRMVTFVMLWAKRNGIDYEMDDYGNIYLTKGTLAEGEFYPCVTAHLDTVQTKQTTYAKAGAKLDVKTRDGSTAHNSVGKHEIYVEGFGIGGDDKAGVLLGLSMFSHMDKLKACFFLEEETGCQGSQKLNKEWFNNVGYVIGYDSPDLNRAAYSCSGTKLMNKKFFEDNGLAEICKNHGLNDFRAEPFTDVVQIRQKTNIVCMNFGTGYYLCHSDNEYCVIEDMDAALDLGVDIINKLGLTEHKMQHVSSGTYFANDVDSKYFEALKPGRATSQYGGGYGGHGSWDDDYDDYYRGYQGYNSGGSYSGGTSTTKSTTASKTEDKVNYEMVQYITEKYEEYIKSIKEQIEAKCKENDIVFDDIFNEVFSKKIEF